MKPELLKQAQILYSQGEQLTKEIEELCGHAEKIAHWDTEYRMTISIRSEKDLKKQKPSKKD